MTRRTLDGEWQLERGPLRPAGDTELTAAAERTGFGTVALPGNLQLQLDVEDVWLDTPELTTLNHHEWFYSRRFEAPAEAGRAIMVFDGVDYFCDVWINGAHAGHHEGAFSTWELDVTDHLAPAGEDNEVVLGISCPWRVDERAFFLQPSTVFSVIVKNSEYMKGNLLHYWDGLPLSGNAVFPFGPWKSVHLERRSGPTLQRVAASTVSIDERSAAVALHCEWWSDAAEAAEVELEIEIAPDNFSGATVRTTATARVDPGHGESTAQVTIADPQLWWTWDTGPQNLYRVRVNGVEAVFGLRTLERDPESLAYSINGRRLFLRGVWYPFANIFSSAPEPADHWRDVEMLREANCNHFVSFTFVEKEALYEAADRLGMLIFQELPYQQLGPMKVVEPEYPRFREFWDWSLGEVDNIVRQLRGHASLVLWGAFAETRKNEEWIWGDYTDYSAAIAAIVEKLDPDSIYHPSFCDFKEEHIWNGGFPFGEFWDHADRNHNFISEFGAIAPPVVETLREVLPPGVIWDNEKGLDGRVALPIDAEEYSYLWSFDYAGLCTSVARMFEHADRNPPSLERFIDAVQWYQAFGLRYCAEIYRRKRFADIAGCRTWSYRENIPGIKFTVVDHRQRPKMGYFGLKAGYEPLQLSVDERRPLAPLAAGSRWERDVWIVNDAPEPRELALTVELLDTGGAERAREERDGSVGADDARTETVALRLPDDPGPYMLRLTATAPDGTVASRAESWLRVAPPAFDRPLRVLLLGQARYNAPVVEALEHVGGIAMSVVDETNRVPQDSEWCADLAARFDVVWFSGWDYAAHQFRALEWQRIAAAVEAGVGFVHTGGQASFHGGDGRGALLDCTALEPVLPVTMRPHDGVWDHEPVLDEGSAAEDLGIALDGMPFAGFSRTAARDGAVVHAALDGYPLLVTGRHGAGATVAFTASLTKPLRMFRIGEGLDWEDPLDVQPHWARRDIKAYSPYWRGNLQLFLGLLAAASDRRPTDRPTALAGLLRTPIFELLAEQPPTELEVEVSGFDYDEERRQTHGVAVVRNRGDRLARLVRGAVVTAATTDHRFRDGFVDLMPGESARLRFEAGCEPDALAGIDVSAQNVAAIRVSP